MLTFGNKSVPLIVDNDLKEMRVDVDTEL